MRKECEPVVDRKYAYLTLKHSWSMHPSGYANACIKGKTTLMHRYLMELEIGRKLKRHELIDHINHNKLDNRLCNLRLVTSTQNSQNRNPITNRFRGTRQQASGRWSVKICLNKKQLSFGTYDTREEAAKIAASKRKELGFLSSQC